MNPFPLGAAIQEAKLNQKKHRVSEWNLIPPCILFLAIQVDLFLFLHSRDTTGPAGNAGWKGTVKHSTK